MRCYEECINDLGDQNAVAISLHQKTEEIRSNHGQGKKRENAVTKFLFCRYKFLETDQDSLTRPCHIMHHVCAPPVQRINQLKWIRITLVYITLVLNMGNGTLIGTHLFKRHSRVFE